MAIGDEIKEQRAKLKGQGVKAHLIYFWDYYKLPTAIILLAVIGVISIVHTIATNKDSAYTLIMLNANGYESTVYDAVYNGFAEYADIDLDQYDMVIDLTESLSSEANSQYDYATTQKIVVQEAARELDTLIANAYQFHRYSLSGSYADLRDIMTEEELSAFEGRIYYVDAAEIRERDQAIEEADYYDDSVSSEEAAAFESVDRFILPDPDEMEEPIPYGIIITDSAFIESADLYGDTVCIWGTAVAAQHVEQSIAFLHFIDETSFYEN